MSPLKKKKLAKIRLELDNLDNSLIKKDFNHKKHFLEIRVELTKKMV